MNHSAQNRGCGGSDGLAKGSREANHTVTYLQEANKWVSKWGLGD